MIINNVKNLKFSGIASVVDKANAINGDVIRLEVGDLDIDTSNELKIEFKKAIDNNLTHYPALVGNNKLIEKICDMLNTQEKLKIKKENILITSGGSMGMYLIFASILEKDDEVLVPMPIWPHLPEMITFCGAKVIEINSLKNFHLDFKDLLKKITPKTKALLINTPNNPTGVIYTKEEIHSLQKICKENNIALISDEEYCDYNYTNMPFTTAIDVNSNTFVSRSFSKKYSIAGLRIGYIVANEEYIKSIKKLSLFTSMYSNSIVQEGLANFIKTSSEDNFCKHTQKLFKEKMNLLVDGFNTCKGLHANYSEGGMYVWLDVSKIGDDQHIADMFLENAHVATVPGSCFGPNGKGFLRISLGASKENIIKAIARIKDLIK